MDDVCPPSTAFGAFHAYGGPKQIQAWEYNGHDAGGSDDLADRAGRFRPPPVTRRGHTRRKSRSHENPQPSPPYWRQRPLAVSRRLFARAAAAASSRIDSHQLVDLGPEPGRRVPDLRHRLREGQPRRHRQDLAVRRQRLLHQAHRGLRRRRRARRVPGQRPVLPGVRRPAPAAAAGRRTSRRATSTCPSSRSGSTPGSTPTASSTACRWTGRPPASTTTRRCWPRPGTPSRHVDSLTWNPTDGGTARQDDRPPDRRQERRARRPAGLRQERTSSRLRHRRAQLRTTSSARPPGAPFDLHARLDARRQATTGRRRFNYNDPRFVADHGLGRAR